MVKLQKKKYPENINDIASTMDVGLEKILVYESPIQNIFIYNVAYNSPPCEKVLRISFDKVDKYNEKQGRDRCIINPS